MQNRKNILDLAVQKTNVEYRVDEGTWQPAETESSLACGDLKTEEAAGVLIVSAAYKLRITKQRFSRQHFFRHDGALRLTIPLRFEGNLLCIYQHKDWWTRPAFAAELSMIPPRTQMILGREANHYFLLLTSASEIYRGDFFPADEANEGVRLILSSNSVKLNSLTAPCFAFCSGDNPYTLIQQAVKALAAFSSSASLREDKTFPELFEYLGWCSWDAFYHEVSRDGLVEKMQELKEKEVPIGWALIDDGWSEADYNTQQLEGLDARSKQFPDKLAGTIRDMQQAFARELKIGVWHASMGYWNGIKPDSPAAVRLADCLEHVPDGRLIPASDSGQAFAFWNYWHAYLKKQGVSFVKADGQSANSLFRWADTDYGTAAEAFHTALEASAAVHFSGNLINCMGMAAQDVWHRPSSVLSRSSDDFVPELKNSFAEHALQNAYNTLWLGQFDYCDWDMFWTRHEDSLHHAVLRAVSGGPVYISDKTGETDPALLKKLADPQGKIYRCDRPAVPAQDCLLQDPFKQNYLKIINRSTYFVIMALYSFTDKKQSVSLCPEDFMSEGSYLAYEHFSGELLNLPKETELPGDAVRLFIIFPDNDDLHAIGLKNKFISPAVSEKTWQIGRKKYFLLRETGPFLLYSRKRIQEIKLNGETIPFTEEDHLYLCDLPEGKDPLILECLVEKL